MLVAIHQLHYLPWLRYVHKIASGDVFVALDNIQFNKNGWQNRNKIKGPQGAVILTVPILHKFAQNLSEVCIDNKQAWQRKHWGTISSCYGKAPFFRDHEAFLKKVYSTFWEKLNDLNHEMLEYFIRALGLQTKIIRGTDLNIQGEATERLVRICKELGAKAYLTGDYALETYLDRSLFEREGIELVIQDFQCPEYPQQFPEEGFVPELSILDLLLNAGPQSLDILLHRSCPSRS